MINRLKTYCRLQPVLGKYKISLPVGLSALTGYLYHHGAFDFKAIMVFFGIFFFSAASSTINHIQEKKEDSLMPRTKNRPLPANLISVTEAIVLAVVNLIIGIACIIPFHNVLVLVLAFVALFWYNLIYTPLKKVTAFAVIPGSVTGAIPPIIGWIAAGGAPLDPRIIIISIFFFIGQIPHFWLLLLLYGEQYELAKMPSLTNIFSRPQLTRLTYTWILTAMGAALLIPFKGIISNNALIFATCFIVFYVIAFTSMTFFIKKELNAKKIFMRLNILYLLMMVVLVVEGIT
ncbi:hypothetical protein EYV94_22405 [Puteibacter caeruleilacunae]|nr:hypothetical protein EYV94_22405 [Puteibacter caeruleilacunae]